MMHYRNIFFILLALFFVSVVALDAEGQRRRHKPIKISRSKARVVCPVFEDSQYPYQGVGVKLGDPFAFTYKFYGSKNFAIALDAGSAASGLYSEHHRNNFDKNFELDSSILNIESFSYLSHTVNSEWVLEGKILFQNDASDLLKGLQWYVGAGLQWRQLDIEYEYLLEINFTDNQIDRFNVKSTTMGPTAALGIEYAYFDLPISAFLEVEGYYDLVENPGWFRLQGGVGLRYVF